MVDHTLRWRRRLPGRRGRTRLVTDGGRPEDDADPDEEGGDQEDGTDPEQEDGQASERDAEYAGDGDDDRGPEGAGGPTDAAERESEPDPVSAADTSGVERANVEVTEAGEAEPARPEWEEPDLDELPEFELRADQPVASGGSGAGGEGVDGDAGGGTAAGADGPDDPTAGMPNTARAPGASRIATDGTEAYIVAVELCARLPDEVRLPEEAADLVPAAVEAELEQDVQAFAAAEFGNERPTVDTLTFEAVDGEVWLRLRIGIPPESFADIDPEAIRAYALEQLEGVF